MSQHASQLRASVWGPFGFLLVGLCLLLPQLADERAVAVPAIDACQDTCVIVEIRGFDSRRGQALVALFHSSAGFPGDIEKASRGVSAKIDKQRTATVVFRNVRPGSIAVAVHHDEDGDYEMDTNWAGIPNEAYGASRDARRTFGPPTFNDAKVTLTGGETKRLRIKVD